MKRRECVYKEAKKQVPPIQISDVDNLCGVVSTFWFAMGVFFTLDLIMGNCDIAVPPKTEERRNRI